jgi:hypothetical protein
VLYEDMLADSVASDTVGDDRRQRRWALSARGLALLRKLKPRWEAAQEALREAPAHCPRFIELQVGALLLGVQPPFDISRGLKQIE